MGKGELGGIWEGPASGERGRLGRIGVRRGLSEPSGGMDVGVFGGWLGRVLCGEVGFAASTLVSNH